MNELDEEDDETLVPHMLPHQLTERELQKTALSNIREFAGIEYIFFVMKQQGCNLDQAVKQLQDQGHRVPAIVHTSPQIGTLNARLLAWANGGIAKARATFVESLQGLYCPREGQLLTDWVEKGISYSMGHARTVPYPSLLNYVTQQNNQSSEK